MFLTTLICVSRSKNYNDNINIIVVLLVFMQINFIEKTNVINQFNRSRKCYQTVA